MAAARFTTAGAALDCALYVMGGFDGAYLTSVERLDPRTPAWQLVRTCMNLGSELQTVLLTSC